MLAAARGCSQRSHRLRPLAHRGRPEKNLLAITVGHIAPQVFEISRLPCSRTGEIEFDGYHHLSRKDGGAPIKWDRSDTLKNSHKNFRRLTRFCASMTLTFPHSGLQEVSRSQKPTVFCGVWRVGKAAQNPAICPSFRKWRLFPTRVSHPFDHVDLARCASGASIRCSGSGLQLRVIPPSQPDYRPVVLVG